MIRARQPAEGVPAQRPNNVDHLDPQPRPALNTRRSPRFARQEWKLLSAPSRGRHVPGARQATRRRGERGSGEAFSVDGQTPCRRASPRGPMTPVASPQTLVQRGLRRGEHLRGDGRLGRGGVFGWLVRGRPPFAVIDLPAGFVQFLTCRQGWFPLSSPGPASPSQRAPPIVLPAPLTSTPLPFAHSLNSIMPSPA